MGGVVPPEPTRRSRLGEPVPGPVTTPLVALAFSAAWTWAGVAEGFSAA